MEYTIAVPVYNESESLVELADRVEATMASVGKSNDFELLFVDDGSTDKSRQVLGDLVGKRPWARSIHLRKNRGKSLALMAAFRSAKGSFIITMDGDLQDNPEDIPKLRTKLNEGYDVVSGWRQSRHDTLLRILGSRLFNRAVQSVSNVDVHDFNCGFKIYRREVVEHIKVFGQYHRYIPLLAEQHGFKVGEVAVENSKRKFGESKYPAIRYQGLFDLLSILFIFRYNFSPLHFFGLIGLTFILPSFLLLLSLVIGHMMFWLGFDLGELRVRPLLFLSVLGLVIGTNIFLTGFVCDFILHHALESGFRQTVDQNVAETFQCSDLEVPLDSSGREARPVNESRFLEADATGLDHSRPG